MLFSIYLSAVSSIACAVVANYTMLLTSRALTGLCVGLTISSHSVVIAKRVSHKAIQEDIMLISSGLMYSLGGVWSAVLGYLLLNVISWRIVILFTSLPIFIPTILFIHFFLVDEEDPQRDEEVMQNTMQTETVVVPNFAARTAKLGLWCAITVFQGWLTILLVPAMIKLLKVKEAEPRSDCTATITQGPELLLLGLVTFAAIPGKLFMHFIRKRVSFRISQIAFASLNAGTFAWMIVQENLAAIVVTNFIIKFLYGVVHQAYCYIWVDVEYFGTAGLAQGNGITWAMGMVGGVVGAVMLAFSPLSSTLITATVLSALQVLVVLTMTEVRL